MGVLFKEMLCVFIGFIYFSFELLSLLITYPIAKILKYADNPLISK